MHASHVAKAATALALAFATSCMGCGGGAPRTHYDVVIAGGTVYDGSGAAGVKGGFGWVREEIKANGRPPRAGRTPLRPGRGPRRAPGFRNNKVGGRPAPGRRRSMSDIKQGVTTEIF